MMSSARWFSNTTSNCSPSEKDPQDPFCKKPWINKFFNWKKPFLSMCGMIPLIKHHSLWGPLYCQESWPMWMQMASRMAKTSHEMSENLAVWCGRAVAPLTEPNGSSHETLWSLFDVLLKVFFVEGWRRKRHVEQKGGKGWIAADLCNLSRNIKFSHLDVGSLPTSVASLFCPLKKPFLGGANSADSRCD